MDEFKKKKDEIKKRLEESNLKMSKKRLIGAIEKKFNTANIGILELIEKYFGRLWGHKENRKLTREEQEMREIWSILRAEILDHGNHQKRAAINEISEYSLKWERYHIDFLPVSLVKKDSE
jgi:hypothetical protein